MGYIYSTSGIKGMVNVSIEGLSGRRGLIFHPIDLKICTSGLDTMTKIWVTKFFFLLLIKSRDRE